MGAVHAAAWRASPTVMTMSGTVSVAAPGAPVLASPISTAQKPPSSHCQTARSGIAHRVEEHSRVVVCQPAMVIRVMTRFKQETQKAAPFDAPPWASIEYY